MYVVMRLDARTHGGILQFPALNADSILYRRKIPVHLVLGTMQYVPVVKKTEKLTRGGELNDIYILF
jgi:hypothetical protein